MSELENDLSEKRPVKKKIIRKKIIKRKLAVSRVK
jgi:hypothetical protein